MSRPPLAGPLARVLVDPVTEASLARAWRSISRRREGVPELRVALRWLFAGVLCGLAVTAAGVALWPRAASPVATLQPGPLLQRSGAAVSAVEVPNGHAATRLGLTDGSEITLDAGCRLEPLASSGSEFVVRLVRGSAAFAVVPGGPRRWVVEAGLARLEVVGTRFRVERSKEAVHVRVEHGVVLVRSTRILDGVARLEAGQDVEVHAPPPVGAGSVGTAAPLPTVLAGRSSPVGEKWREAAALGRHAEAYALLGSAGIDREVRVAVSSEDLFVLADVARLSAHPERARAPLGRLLDAFPRDPRAALAAVTLGRIELDLGQPSAAARAFERALAIGAPLGLEEDVRVRLVESWVRAGNSDAAHAVAETYERRFPNGRHQAEVRRWLGRLPDADATSSGSAR